MQISHSLTVSVVVTVAVAVTSVAAGVEALISARPFSKSDSNWLKSSFL
jgi:hypothetical protein